MKTVLCIIIIILVNSCQYGIGKQNEHEKLFDQLLGEWELVEGQTVEIWKKKKESYEGSVINIIHDDTIVTENLNLLETDTGIYYSAAVFNQNDGKAITFKMIFCNTNRMVFENKNHDFPKIIEYEIIDENNIRTIIRADELPGSSYIESYYRRI